MLTRKLLSLFGAVALVAGVALSAQYAVASPPARAPAEKSPGPVVPKAKQGEACKVTDDCEMSPVPLSCVKGKCEVDHKRMPPPPT
jgi:hypothetical protein